MTNLFVRQKRLMLTKPMFVERLKKAKKKHQTQQNSYFSKKWNMRLFAIAKIWKSIVMKSVCLMMKGSARQTAF